MSNNSSYNQGRNDQNKGYGQRPPSSFGSDSERKSYQSGWNNSKEVANQNQSNSRGGSGTNK